MRPQPATIRLGAREWLIRPLTLAQVQAIEPLLFAAGDTPAGSVAAAIAILRVALSRDHGEAAASLDEVEAQAPEISAAMAAILRLGGFLPGGSAPGEAEAGATPAATGAPSTRA